MAGTTMTIFICAVVLSLYGPRLWEAATDAVGVGPHAIGDAVNEIWSHGPPEVLWIAAKTVRVVVARAAHGMQALTLAGVRHVHPTGGEQPPVRARERLGRSRSHRTHHPHPICPTGPLQGRRRSDQDQPHHHPLGVQGQGALCRWIPRDHHLHLPIRGIPLGEAADPLLASGRRCSLLGQGVGVVHACE
ncbi:hypothetical protein P171DRAFT_34229 [Karstenula rhodostoma CBS 690.94]|uniref:Uncharacterized protein n=1 Tax=Karstenula rhodostoma CBS 690.94 TaxID=1392251 RepID=A0A9P4PKI5_9PLEO|nr:hypothetical protein P171DRAFT_34229 [Karstenula rhodostoma CBS 690.94]